MVDEIYLDKLINASPEKTESLAGMLSDVVKFTGDLDKIVSTFQKWGVSPEVVEKLAIKFGALDEVPELPKSERVQVGIVGTSDLHNKMFEELNKLSEKELAIQIKAMQEQQKKAGK